LWVAFYGTKDVNRFDVWIYKEIGGARR
jgi:hypothetical protein